MQIFDWEHLYVAKQNLDCNRSLQKQNGELRNMHLIRTTAMTISETISGLLGAAGHAGACCYNGDKKSPHKQEVALGVVHNQICFYKEVGIFYCKFITLSECWWSGHNRNDFTSAWVRKWQQFLKPVTKRSNAKTKAEASSPFYSRMHSDQAFVQNRR